MSRICIPLAAFIGLLSVSHLSAAEIPSTLSGYVEKADATYRWRKYWSGEIGEGTYTELILTSQKWKGEFWNHQLFVFKPASVRKDADHALLFIGGGNWSDDLKCPMRLAGLPREAALFAAFAEQLQTPVAVLLQVPRQPMFNGLTEDQIIALTFSKYMQGGSDDWPLLLPMVKSAVRAMDAVQEFAKQQWSLRLKTFTVTGASKRGWTTWLTAAVDHRVTAIAPMVIDLQDMASQVKHQRRAWGHVSPMLKDYTERDLHNLLVTKRGQELRRLVDPISYRDRLKQPKLIVTATNDRYWPVDALNVYWDQLKGEKYILNLPNSRHARADWPRLIGTLNALNRQAAFGKKLPKLTWTHREKCGAVRLVVRTDRNPVRVRAWTAVAETRDFREAKWTPHPMRKGCDTFVFEIAIPQKGCAAVFGEVVYASEGSPFYLSTQIRIVGTPVKSKQAEGGLR